MWKWWIQGLQGTPLEIFGKPVQYWAQFSATKNVNLYLQARIQDFEMGGRGGGILKYDDYESI